MDNPQTPVRGERVTIGHDPHIADELRAHVLAHADVASEVVLRPMVGVVLQLPDWANAGKVAHAIDAEQVTAGYLDFQGRCCVAVPADPEHLPQTAHTVAKVLHGLLEIHTPYINQCADDCAEPAVLTVADEVEMMEAVIDQLGANSMFVQQVHAVRALALSRQMRSLVEESLKLIAHAIMAGAGSGREQIQGLA